MPLEALWAITFGTEQSVGAGVIVFETERIFGGDTCFYYVGHYTYDPRAQTITGEVEVTRHTPGFPFVFPSQEGGRVRLRGQLSEPIMSLTGYLVQDPHQTIEVHCRHLADLP